MKKGFSLIEIAIALVIIGLLVGAVYKGRTLIDAMQVKSEVYKLKKIRTAYAEFVSKYGRMPGEVVNPDLSGTDFDTLRYGTKEAMAELVREGLINDQDFKIGIIPDTYWNIAGCATPDTQIGSWLIVRPHLSRNICVFPTNRLPSDDDRTMFDRRAPVKTSQQFICHIEKLLDDSNINSGLGRRWELSDAYRIDDYSNCYNLSDDTGAELPYYFKVF